MSEGVQLAILETLIQDVVRSAKQIAVQEVRSLNLNLFYIYIYI